MGVARPLKRTVRPFVDGKYLEGGRWMYIRHPAFASEPEHFIRAFEIIQKDLISLFDYVEPDDVNLATYSYRIHELLVRVCIEVEANFKAILTENNYTKTDAWNMGDYKKIEATHFLSHYMVRLPVWRDRTKDITPFAGWTMRGKPDWYVDYNSAKHDRHTAFRKANFGNLVDAVAGLVALITSQSLNGAFANAATLIVMSGPSDGFETAIGDYFRIKYPENIPIADRYDFDWRILEGQSDPFDTSSY